MRGNAKGQVTAELAVLFAFVIAGFIGMGFYLQRGIQGSTKANADSVGQQFTKASGYSSFAASDSHEAIAGDATNTTSTSCSNSQQNFAGGATTLTNCGPRNLESAGGPVLEDTVPSSEPSWR